MDLSLLDRIQSHYISVYVTKLLLDFCHFCILKGFGKYQAAMNARKFVKHLWIQPNYYTKFLYNRRLSKCA